MNWIEIKNGRVRLLRLFPKRMTMKARLLAAIEKWDAISAYHYATGATVVLGGVTSETCALCARYDRLYHCQGCPVSAKTGQGNCVGSPYIGYKDRPSTDTAKKEATFLRALLKGNKRLHPPIKVPKAAPKGGRRCHPRRTKSPI